MQAVLYLIPSPISASAANEVLPPRIRELVNQLDHFVVEDLRTARRNLREMGCRRDLNEIDFQLLNKHTPDSEYDAMLDPLRKGMAMGLMSDAGAPGIADPGSALILAAHKEGFRVIPLTGPSSISLALMSSGMNGQNFTFHGYLPVKQDARVRKIRELEHTAAKTGYTQVFMETPYRNMSLLKDILNHARPGTLLCIAADITSEGEMIRTRTISEWKNDPPEIHKRPAIFLLK